MSGCRVLGDFCLGSEVTVELMVPVLQCGGLIIVWQT
jgi:hypothetical protein